jgi:hypothetical protein
LFDSCWLNIPNFYLFSGNKAAKMMLGKTEETKQTSADIVVNQKLQVLQRL